MREQHARKRSEEDEADALPGQTPTPNNPSASEGGGGQGQGLGQSGAEAQQEGQQAQGASDSGGRPTYLSIPEEEQQKLLKEAYLKRRDLQVFQRRNPYNPYDV